MNKPYVTRMRTSKGLMLTVSLLVVVIYSATVASTRAQDAVDRERQAIFTVRELGGKVSLQSTPHGERVVGIDLHGTDVFDDGLSRLEGLASLRDLSLDGAYITDAGLASLSGL